MDPANALSLVIFYLGAFATPLIAGRLRLPAAVGEILFGVAVGTSGLGLVYPTPFTRFLYELGFMFLMFLVGMEIDFNQIEREGARRVGIAALVASSILSLGWLMVWRLSYPSFLALILGAMSVGIALVALRDIGASQTRFGQMILLVGSIGEFLTLLGLTGYTLVHLYGVGTELAIEILKVFLLFGVAYAILAVLRLAVWWFPHTFRRWVDVQDPSELGVRAGFVLMLSLAALSGWVGLEPILGAFLAGSLFSFVFREKGILETKLSAVGQGLFIPLFFIHVGVSFDVRALGETDTLARTLLILAGASLAAKMVPSLLLVLSGFRIRQVVAGGFLLATPLTLLVAAASIGQRVGVLDPRLNSAIVLLAIVSGIAFPTIFKLLATPAPAELEEPVPPARSPSYHLEGGSF